MPKRRIDTIWNGSVRVNTYYDKDYQEYSNVLIVDGKKQNEATTYYTTDKADAISTAADMLNREYAAIKAMNELVTKYTAQ